MKHVMPNRGHYCDFLFQFLITLCCALNCTLFVNYNLQQYYGLSACTGQHFVGVNPVFSQNIFQISYMKLGSDYEFRFSTSFSVIK